MPIVFVTQIPKSKNLKTGKMFPIIDLEPAAAFGNIQVMFDSMPNFSETNNILSQIESYLENYNFNNGDSIICTGDPMLLAFSCAYLGSRFGLFNYLKWNKHSRAYKKVTVDVR